MTLTKKTTRLFAIAIAIAVCACGSDPVDNGKIDSQIEPPDPDVVETDTGTALDTSSTDTSGDEDTVILVPDVSDTTEAVDTTPAPDTTPPPVEIYRFEPTGTACESNADCTDATKATCDPHFKVCVECVVGTDCGFYSLCVNYECEATDICYSDEDCADSPDGNTCYHYKCGECATDWDCAPNERCNRDFQCETDQWSAPCDTDADCPNGGHCWYDYRRCSQCTDDAHCGEGEACHWRECVPEGSPYPLQPIGTNLIPYKAPNHWPAPEPLEVETLPVQLCESDADCPEGIRCADLVAGRFCEDYAPQPEDLECWVASNDPLFARDTDYGPFIDYTKRLESKDCPNDYHCRADGRCYPDVCNLDSPEPESFCSRSSAFGGRRNRDACLGDRFGTAQACFQDEVCVTSAPGMTSCVEAPVEPECPDMAPECPRPSPNLGDNPVPYGFPVAAWRCYDDGYQRVHCAGKACFEGNCISPEEHYGVDKWP